MLSLNFHLVAGALMVFIILAIGKTARADFDENVVNTAKAATVRIVTDMAGGTGFFINRQGNLVTNYHVIEGAKKVEVFFVQGNKAFRVPATIVASQPGKDLAILKCEFPFAIKPFIIASRDAVGGQTVMALGFPGILDKAFSFSSADGMQPTGKLGEYTLNHEAVNFFTAVTFPGNVGKEMQIASSYGANFRGIAHNAKISEGNSGGPLIDLDGRLVGVNAQVAGSHFGIDYSFSIHASELVALARAHSIPMDVTSSKASISGALTRLQLLLFIVLGAFAVVLFLLVLRKPRAVMVGAVSKLIHSQRHAPGQPVGRSPIPAPVPPASNDGRMRLRGRDLQGLSFDLALNEADFRRGGGRLVIGRNQDLSQLVLSHDSISRQHATLSWLGGVVHVEDRNSGNGTKINGRELIVGAPPTSLRPGDKLTLGELELIFEVFR